MSKKIRKPVGVGGCGRGQITLSGEVKPLRVCNRKWSMVRITSKGVKVCLCDDCDEMFGKIVGALDGIRNSE